MPERSVESRGVLGAFVATAILAAAVVWQSESTALAEDRQHAERLAESYAAAIHRDVERAISATYPLAALVQESGGIPSNFEALAAQLLPYYQGASALALAPGGVVRAIVPFEGNEKAIGHDLLNDPNRDREARLARDTGMLTLAGPFDLVQGGLAAAARLPVYHPHDVDRKDFWGFVSVLVRFPDVLQAADLAHLSSDGYAYELWRVHPDTGKRTIIAHAGGTLVEPVHLPIEVPNATWTLSVAPENGWFEPGRLLAKGLIALLISSMLAVLYHAIASLRRERTELEERVEERTRALAQSERSFRLLSERASDVIYRYHLDPPGFDYLSPSVERVTGYPPAAYYDDPRLMSKLIHPDDREMLESLAYRKAPHTACMRWRGRDGQWIWTEHVNRPILDDAGAVVGWEGIARDFTERKNMEDSLRQSEQRFRDIANVSADWIWEVDAEGRYTFVSESVFTLLRYQPEELLGKTPFDFMAPDEAQRVAEAFGVFVAARQPFRDLENVVLGKDGTPHVTLTNGTPVFDGDGTLIGYRGVDRDVSAQRRLESQIRELADFDSLTHLPNRRVFADRLKQAIASNSRDSRHGALMFIDLDNFKPLNDLHGHDAGDLLLAEVAERLRRCVREMDTVARFGGDEFVVILAALATDARAAAEHAAMVAESILRALSVPYRLPRGDEVIEHRCTASVGVTVFRGHETSPETLLQRADAAMYEAKARGRHAVRFSKPSESTT